MKTLIEPRVLDVSNSPSEKLDKLTNGKLRDLAKAVKSGELKTPSAGHLNYFKTTS